MDKIRKAIKQHRETIDKLDLSRIHHSLYNVEQREEYYRASELRRLEIGTYELPDFLLDHIQPDQILADIPHLPRLSCNTDIDKIVKLKRLTREKNNRNVPLYESIKISRYIKKLNPTLSDNDLNELSSRLKNHRLQNAVKTTNNSRLIKAVYIACFERGGVQSCMAGKHRYKWQFQPPLHPALVYGGESGIKLAYIRHNKVVVARALYSDKNQAYLRIYGDSPHSNQLEHFFSEQNYYQSDSALDGHVINNVFVGADDETIVPYIDGHSRVNINGDKVTIDESGKFYAYAYQTCVRSHLTKLKKCRSCCNAIDMEDNNEYINAADGSLFCDSECADRHDYFCDVEDEWHYIDELFYSNYHSAYILFAHLSDFDIYKAVDDEYYHLDDLVLFDDNYYPFDNLSFYDIAECVACSDFFKTDDKKTVIKNNGELIHQFCSSDCANGVQS